MSEKKYVVKGIWNGRTAVLLNWKKASLEEKGTGGDDFPCNFENKIG